MRIGAVYPQIELEGDPEAVRQLGASLEELGYDHLIAYDHVLGAVHADREPPLIGPYTENDPFHDPLMLFAYLAGRTSRLEFATGVMILPQRQTALVARQVADLSLLSGGRVRFGVGTGWNPVEYDALGQDFVGRGQRLDEQVVLLRRLWTEHVVEHHGATDRVDRAGILPRPRRPVPLWFGGMAPVAFRRAARLGDGFFYGGSMETALEQWSRTKEYLVEFDRDPSTFGAEYVMLSKSILADGQRRVDRWAEAGGSHASIISMRLGLDSVAAHLDYFGRVAEMLELPERRRLDMAQREDGDR